MRWLANRYNVELEKETIPALNIRPNSKPPKACFSSTSLRDYFSQQLFETDEGRDIALAYLRERGFRDDIIRKFQLGYNPAARDQFTKAATDAQYSQELLLKSGLVANRDDRWYDNYRGRIIFLFITKAEKY